jgi:uncharacterized protein (DUF1810 family)
MTSSGIKYHPTVSAYRRVIRKAYHHKHLDNVSTFKTYLSTPQDYNQEVKTIVHAASYMLKVVLGRLEDEVLEGLEDSTHKSFMELFGWPDDMMDIFTVYCRSLLP